MPRLPTGQFARRRPRQIRRARTLVAFAGAPVLTPIFRRTDAAGRGRRRNLALRTWRRRDLPLWRLSHRRRPSYAGAALRRLLRRSSNGRITLRRLRGCAPERRVTLRPSTSARILLLALRRGTLRAAPRLLRCRGRRLRRRPLPARLATLRAIFLLFGFRSLRECAACQRSARQTDPRRTDDRDGHRRRQKSSSEDASMHVPPPLRSPPATHPPDAAGLHGFAATGQKCRRQGFPVSGTPMPQGVQAKLLR